MPGHARFAQTTTDRETIQTRQHDVENNGVVESRARIVQRIAPVADHVGYVVLFFQTPFQGLSERKLVFDDENPHTDQSKHPRCELAWPRSRPIAKPPP